MQNRTISIFSAALVTLFVTKVSFRLIIACIKESFTVQNYWFFLNLKVNSSITCVSPGKFAHEDPTKYHECYYVGENNYTMRLQDCPVDSCFDSATGVCKITHCERRHMGTKAPITFKCPSKGKFPHVDSSRRDAFYKCLDIHGNLYVYEYQCLPVKPCFSASRQMCQPCWINCHFWNIHFQLAYF